MRSKYVVETAETHIGNVVAHLDALGAWLDYLDNCAGTLRLRFRALEANMRGFDEWLKRATNGTGKFYAGLN